MERNPLTIAQMYKNRVRGKVRRRKLGKLDLFTHIISFVGSLSFGVFRMCNEYIDQFQRIIFLV